MANYWQNRNNIFPVLELVPQTLSAIPAMDPQVWEDITQLTIKEFLSQFKGILPFSREQWNNKESLLDHILANAVPEDIDFVRSAGAMKCAEREDAQVMMAPGRKRKRNDTQNAYCVTHRHTSTNEPTKFLDLPAPDQVKSCHWKFYNATSNLALKLAMCSVSDS